MAGDSLGRRRAEVKFLSSVVFPCSTRLISSAALRIASKNYDLVSSQLSSPFRTTKFLAFAIISRLSPALCCSLISTSVPFDSQGKRN